MLEEVPGYKVSHIPSLYYARPWTVSAILTPTSDSPEEALPNAEDIEGIRPTVPELFTRLSGAPSSVAPRLSITPVLALFPLY